MSEHRYRYIIVGGGLAGASAIKGIREQDTEGSILLIGKEEYLPYDRPPLSKKLWLGTKKLERIYLHDEQWYVKNQVDLALGVEIEAVDAQDKALSDGRGNIYRYEKLLLATGGSPRTLDLPGATLEEIYHYRYLGDYLRMRTALGAGSSAVVIGGGFIGSEMAAVLNANQVDVTMIFPDAYVVQRVFPESLGLALQRHFAERGIALLTGDVPVSFERSGGKVVTRTRGGKAVASDVVIVGVGILPEVGLARSAGLTTENGVVVNEYLQTSHPDIYAAGDNAFFPYQVLGLNTRIEHWDNSLSQGKHAGRNMAGATASFAHMPYFYSDLFEFGYEAVGEVHSRLETFADWQKENETGVIYYLKEGKVRGVMMCNVWSRVDAARELIKRGDRVTVDDLRGAIQ